MQENRRNSVPEHLRIVSKGVYSRRLRQSGVVVRLNVPGLYGLWVDGKVLPITSDEASRVMRTARHDG